MDRMVLLGRISSVNYQKGCADVIFPDAEDMIRKELPFFSFEYRMPKVNELVVVLFQENKKQGYILGHVFNEEYLPEFFGKENYFKRFSRRAYIKYDDATGVMEFHAPRIRFIEEG